MKQGINCFLGEYKFSDFIWFEKCSIHYETTCTCFLGYFIYLLQLGYTATRTCLFVLFRFGVSLLYVQNFVRDLKICSGPYVRTKCNRSTWMDHTLTYDRPQCVTLVVQDVNLFSLQSVLAEVWPILLIYKAFTRLL